jgi:serine/threonine protein kinase
VTPERWRQINDLFHALVDQDASSRRAALDAAASTDAELAAEVRSLLAAHDSGEVPIDRPVWAVAPHVILEDGTGLAPGAQVGPYRIVREIGRGGMGVVYEAEDTRLRRAVALKALPAPYTRDPLRRERLMREARAAAALAHPSIATIFALDEIDGVLFLASELVRGDTLRAELARGPLPTGLLQRTLLELASGLAAAHAAGIVHRDFKPENIIRCSDGRVKILDFGLARMSAPGAVTELRLTQAGMAIGTPGYMAPEQLGGKDVDARSDVFAFGIVAWELATGEHPFGASAADLLSRMADLIDRPHGASPAASLALPRLEAITRRCLRRDPANRYASAQELLADLEQADVFQPRDPQPAEPDARPLRWWQIHQAIIALVVAAMPVACWFVRRWDAQIGSGLFLVVLALSTISVTSRLNLLFTSRVHPAQLAKQRARVYVTMAAVEAILGLLLLASAALVAGPHDALAAVLVTLAVATVASLGIIEPATTAAAMGKEEG